MKTEQCSLIKINFELNQIHDNISKLLKMVHYSAKFYKDTIKYTNCYVLYEINLGQMMPAVKWFLMLQ